MPSNEAFNKLVRHAQKAVDQRLDEGGGTVEKLNLQSLRPRCPYCHDDVEPGGDNRACHECLTWHHEECWDNHGSCVTCGNVWVEHGGGIASSPAAHLFAESTEDEEKKTCWIHDTSIEPSTKMDLYDLWGFDIETLASQCTCHGPLPEGTFDLGEGNDAARVAHLIATTNLRLNAYRERERKKKEAEEAQRRLAEEAAEEDRRARAHLADLKARVDKETSKWVDHGFGVESSSPEGYSPNYTPSNQLEPGVLYTRTKDGRLEPMEIPQRRRDTMAVLREMVLQLVIVVLSLIALIWGIARALRV